MPAMLVLARDLAVLPVPVFCVGVLRARIGIGRAGGRRSATTAGSRRIRRGPRAGGSASSCAGRGKR